MEILTDFVQVNKQRLARVLNHDQVVGASLGTPPANGTERKIFLARTRELVYGEAFTPQAFTDFIETMRGLVGLIRPAGASRGFSYQPGPAESYSYLEFNHHNSKPVLDIICHFGVERSSFLARTITIGTYNADCFRIKVPLNYGCVDLNDLSHLFQIGKGLGLYDEEMFDYFRNEIDFHKEANQTHGGKGALRWGSAILSNTMARFFCANVLQRFAELPANYHFLNGEETYLKNNTPERGFFK